MNILKWVLIGIAAGFVLYFLVVAAAYAVAITLAKFTPAFPVEDLVPDPHTGKPVLAKGTLRFGARLPALFYVLTGHWYAQTLAWPTDKGWTPTVCLPDHDIEGETFYHELLIHGRAWLRLKFRFLPLQFRSVLLNGYRGDRHEEHAYFFGDLWKDVSPSYRLEPATREHPHGVLRKFYRNEKARIAWEEKWALRPRVA